MKTYIFESDQLGFRNWEDGDIDVLHEINTDKEVMEFFPSCPSLMETHDFVHRMQQQYLEKNFCYFAVDLLQNASFIGFIGFSTKDFKADFTPCTDIGWKLKKSEWNKGYATEGARACLDYAFNMLKMPHIVAIAPAINIKSELVMKKIGMSKVKTLYIHCWSMIQGFGTAFFMRKITLLISNGVYGLWSAERDIRQKTEECLQEHQGIIYQGI